MSIVHGSEHPRGRRNPRSKLDISPPSPFLGGRGPSPPNGPNGPLRGPESTKNASPMFRGGRRRRRVSRGDSGAQ
eukprot:379505-Alexandrium_andersonii.AAC.1